MLSDSPFGARTRLALGRKVAASIVLSVHFALAGPARAALESGVYQTLSGATVEERGDRVIGGSRIVPFSATLTFDLRASQPSLTAVIPNAVLEGGDPFQLTVRSSSGAQLADGTYRFMGDYLRDISPSGTQYIFDWRFSTSTGGQTIWNGISGWAGGHIWQVTISDVTIVPEPGTLTLMWAGIGVFYAGFCKGLRSGRRLSQAEPGVDAASSPAWGKVPDNPRLSGRLTSKRLESRAPLVAASIAPVQSVASLLQQPES
jgi:hypothetical protein